ncbi:hypothetical protein ACRAWG_35375 [Methylobacterium sp. P31]
MHDRATNRARHRLPGAAALRHSAAPATNERAFMTLTDLDKPAELTLWPGHAPAHTADARSFPTLRAALAAAAEAIDTANAKPWIITEAGDILAPGWNRANTGSRSLQ